MSDLPFDLALAFLVGLVFGALPAFFLARRRKPEPTPPKKSVALRPEKPIVERVHTAYETTAAPLPSYRNDTSNEVSMLRNELEQCTIELNILRQDYDLDTYLLKQELDQTKAQLSRERASIEQERKAIEQERASLADVRAQYQDERTPLKRERDNLAEERKLLDQEANRLAEERTALDEATGKLEEERSTLHRTREVLAEQAERLATLEASLKEREAELEGALEGAHRQQTPLIEFTTRPKVQSIRTISTPSPPPKAPAPTYAPPGETPANDHAQAREAPPTVETREGSRPAYAPLPSLIDTPATDPIAASSAPLHDPLTRIGGIDPEIEQQLFGMGFSTFDDIIGMSSTDIQQIARKLDLDPKHIQAHWVSQAQLLRYEPQKK